MLIPLRDRVPTRRPAAVMWTIIALNSLAFIAQVLYLLTNGADAYEELLVYLALVPADYAQIGQTGLTAGMAIPWVTHMFLHGGVLHFGINMLFFWVFADNIEDRMGHWRFAVFYLISGLVAAGAYLALNIHSTVPMVGASGAISGALGAYLLLYPMARVLSVFLIVIIPIFLRVRAIVFILVWIGFQVVLQMVEWMQPDEGRGGVAYLAHIGGFVVGLVLCKPFVIYRRPPVVTRTGRMVNEGGPPRPPLRYRRRSSEGS